MQKDNLTAYHDIVVWAWKYFKKYYLEYDADKALTELLEYVHKFEKESRLHEFAFRMCKVAWDEAGQLHEMRLQNERNETN